MLYPKREKKLKAILTSVERALTTSASVVLGAGLLAVCSAQAPPARPMAPTGNLSFQEQSVRPLASQYLLRIPGELGSFTSLAQHSSHSSHASHASHSSHSSHSSGGMFA